MRLLVLLPIIKMLSLFFKRLEKYSKKLFDQLLFNEIVIISLEAYYEFLIGGYMNILFSMDDKSGETIGTYSAYYAICVCVIILPGIMVFILLQGFDKLKEPSF